MVGREAAVVEYTRCTRCRNPIRRHQVCVQDPAGDACFHNDCWAATLAQRQQEYAERAHDEGPLSLLTPYVVRLGAGSPLSERCEQQRQAAEAALADAEAEADPAEADPAEADPAEADPAEADPAEASAPPGSAA
jgi:hypothetical protein